MTAKFERIDIGSDNELRGLLGRLKGGDKEVILGVTGGYKTNILNDVLKIKEKIREEFLRRGVRKVMFFCYSNEMVDILEFLRGVNVEYCLFAIQESSEILQNATCKKLLKYLREFDQKKLNFRFHLRRVPDYFISDLADKMADKGNNKKLGFFLLKIGKIDAIKLLKLSSHLVLDKLCIFESLQLRIESFFLPRQFTHKLIYLNLAKIEIIMGAENSNIAFELIFKNLSDKLCIKFNEVEQLKPLLPLFVINSDRFDIGIDKPKHKISRLSLKLVLKYYQFFSYTFVSKEETGYLPCTDAEIRFLEQQRKLTAYNYLSS